MKKTNTQQANQRNP